MVGALGQRSVVFWVHPQAISLSVAVVANKWWRSFCGRAD